MSGTVIDGASSRAARVEHVMGMPISIDIRDTTAHEDLAATEQLLDACFDSLRMADSIFSRWRPDSPISRLGDGRASLQDMPIEVIEVLRSCARWSRATDGFFRARGRDGRIDPTGLVKGWAVARVGRLLLAAGCRHWCVNAAGDVLVHGQARPGQGWAVGIVDPGDVRRLIDTVSLTVGAVATSGSAERGAHIWGRSGAPSRGVVSATVIARDIERADVLATAAVAYGPAAGSWLEGFPGVQALIVRDDGSMQATSGWPGSIAVSEVPENSPI